MKTRSAQRTGATPRGGSIGFTLIELLVAITLMVIVTGIVYSSFFAVVTATDTARVAAEQLRLRQFLTRSFSQNLSQTYGDWRPGAIMRELPGNVETAVRNMDGNVDVEGDETLARYWLEGIDDQGAYGPADSITFATTAPLIGGTALPGVLKQVTYEVVRGTNEEGDFLELDDDVRSVTLQATETPIFEAADFEEGDDAGDFDAKGDLLGDVTYESPGWSVPVRTMDIQYFDGEDWVDDWDSVEMGRLPWSVHIRINFARPPSQLRAEASQGFNDEDDPDYEFVISLPGGVGLTEPPLQMVHGIDPNTASTNTGRVPPPQP